MDNDPGILCYHHCTASSGVFCRSVPATCPICSERIGSFLVEPFRVPYPLANAAHSPASVVCRPACGSFLDDYDATRHDLHVGIVDSRAGRVVEFDRGGLTANDVASSSAGWTDCVAVGTVVTVAWTARWDETLALMLKDPKWRSVNYDEADMNCFNFVLEFLNNLGHADLRFASKEDLCQRLLLSKVQSAVRYGLLYRALKSREYLLSCDNNV